MKTLSNNNKKMLALVHLVNCKLFQSFYKHKIIPCNSFHIPGVLKGLPRNKSKMKPITGFPVAQMVEHGASNAKIMGSIPRESKS